MNSSKKISGLILLGLMIFSTGCVPLNRFGLNEEGPQASPEEAIQNARHYLETNPNWNTDCSHFVLACYHSPEMADFFRKQKPGENLTYYLNRYLTLKKTRRKKAADIQPGDIIIFNKTYDLNHDGHIDDKDIYTHAGIVESFQDMVVTYIDASAGRKPPKLHRRKFGFYGEKYNETVATDPATGRKIHHRETFYAAYAIP